MTSLGLSGDGLKKFVYVTAVLFAIFLALLSGVMDGFIIGLHTIARVPSAIALTIAAWAAIIEWGWKSRPFIWVLRVPVLAGTWTGHLESDWLRGAGDPSRQIPIVFVIRQNLLSITVVSFTKDRHGVSYVAQLLKNEAANLTRLVYVYSLREEFRAGEGMQQGAAEVQVIGSQARELRGEYWTNTETRGRLILSRRSSKEVSSFNEASSKWPHDQWQAFDP